MNSAGSVNRDCSAALEFALEVEGRSVGWIAEEGFGNGFPGGGGVACAEVDGGAGIRGIRGCGMKAIS